MTEIQRPRGGVNAALARAVRAVRDGAAFGSGRARRSGDGEGGDEPWVLGVEPTAADVETSVRELGAAVRQLVRREERMSDRVNAFESDLIAEIGLLAERIARLEETVEATQRLNEPAERRL